jgi:hypothetical protein
VAFGSEVVTMVSGALAIIRLSCCVADTGPGWPCEESVTFTVKVLVPAAVGVPEIAPAALKESPAGSEEPLARFQMSEPAPPLACNVAL